MKSQARGWIIATPGPADFEADVIPELFSLTTRYTPAEIIEILIKPKIHEGGLEAKAYATLVGLKLKYPDHRFLHEKSVSELPYPWARRALVGGSIETK